MSVKAAKRDFARATREAERAVIAGWHELEDTYDTAADRGQDLAGSARDWGYDVAGSARDLAGAARDRARDARERAIDARERAHRAAGRGQELAGTARDRAAEARDRVLSAQREAWRRGEAARDALAGRKTHQRRTLFLVAAAGVGAGAALVIASRRWAAARERARMDALLPDIDDIDGEALPDFPPTATS